MNKNTKTLASVFGFVVFMIGLSFAAVPAYRLFCQVTGFAGTTQEAAALPDTVLDRAITVKFDANTSRNLPWRFEARDRAITVKIGQKGLTSFISENKTDIPTAGTAIYNVTPLKAGKYFNKIQCFCFDEQTLMPGEIMDMPVMFFIDPAIADAPTMDDVTEITLSYSFFAAESEELDAALEAFYNDKEITTDSSNL